MNIVLILASGVGNRFGDPIPKQYHLVRGRPAIEYVINSAITSCADEVLIVSSANYVKELSTRYGVHVTEGGTERNRSVQRGLDYINANFSCDKVIILDAVNPLVKPELINRYFRYLDENDIVFTALKIPVSLGSYDSEPMDRSKYFMMASPEGYRFMQLYQHFDGSVVTDSIIHQLPVALSRKPCFEMRDFAKIIYPHDIAVIEAIMQEREKKRTFSVHLNDFTLALLQRLREPYPQVIKAWEKEIDKEIEALFFKWNISEFSLVTNANSSIVFEAFSETHGDVILKIVPACFANRYQSELHMLAMLPDQVCCKIIDRDDDKRALLLERVLPGDYIHFEHNADLLEGLFHTMEGCAGTIPAGNSAPAEFQSFLDFFAFDIRVAEKSVDEGSQMARLLAHACSLYQTHFLSLPQRLIHGDICFKNLLKRNGTAILIDPLGLVAPIEIEIANYFAYEIFESYENHKEMYHKISAQSSGFLQQDDLDKALFVTLTIKLWATCISGTNGSKANAEVWSQIITDLFLEDGNALKTTILID